MSVLSYVLERLRRVGPPPGAAAGVVAVPSAGDELSREVSFLFAQLDELERRSELILSESRSEAAALEAAARQERSRLLEKARADAERLAGELLAAGRSASDQRARVLLAVADREAVRVLARGRERTPALVDEILEHVLEAAP